MLTTADIVKMQTMRKDIWPLAKLFDATFTCGMSAIHMTLIYPTLDKKRAAESAFLSRGYHLIQGSAGSEVADPLTHRVIVP